MGKGRGLPKTSKYRHIGVGRLKLLKNRHMKFERSLTSEMNLPQTDLKYTFFFYKHMKFRNQARYA